MILDEIYDGKGNKHTLAGEGGTGTPEERLAVLKKYGYLENGM